MLVASQANNIRSVEFLPILNIFDCQGTGVVIVIDVLRQHFNDTLLSALVDLVIKEVLKLDSESVGCSCLKRE